MPWAMVLSSGVATRLAVTTLLLSGATLSYALHSTRRFPECSGVGVRRNATRQREGPGPRGADDARHRQGLTNDLSDGDRRRLALLCVTNAVATMQMSYEGVLLAFNDAKTKLLTPTKVL